MVRQLIQGFLQWLRQVLVRISKPQRTRQPLTSRKQLPPSPLSSTRRQPEVSTQSPLSPQTTRDLQGSRPQVTSAKASIANLQQAAQQLPPLPPQERPTSAVPSPLKGLLKEYPYAPSPAIQELNQQLAEAEPLSPPLDSPLTETEIVARKIVSPSPPTPALEKSQTDVEPIDPWTEQEVYGSPQEIGQGPPQQSQIVSALATDDELSTPSPSKRPTAPPILKPVVPASSSGIITTTGFIKLLFKLKKSNYHGYITPNDGSKDIIFHQKYIGDDVFFQLERGMEVEVTAHLTEGKAYADSVRIL